jgi:hypothetical protein
MIVKHCETTSHSDKSVTVALQKLIDSAISEVGREPDEIQYEMVDAYYDGHFTRYTALLIWFDRPIEVHTHVYIDGKKIADAVASELARKGRQ